ncbi:hypothetical protein DIPPA_28609 [Diplonema papillatum]|nr:hypothetical protein DIPPA_28609 [Diplonema papillatum]
MRRTAVLRLLVPDGTPPAAAIAKKVCTLDAGKLLEEIDSLVDPKFEARKHRRFLYTLLQQLHTFLKTRTTLGVHKATMKRPPYGELAGHISLLHQAIRTGRGDFGIRIVGADQWISRWGDEPVDIEWLAEMNALVRPLPVDIDFTQLESAEGVSNAGVAEVSLASLCELEEVYTLRTLPQRTDGVALAVRRGMVQAFSTRCPHVGLELNTDGDEIWCTEEKALKCFAHGALFEPDTGHCFFGPCSGKSLQPVPVRVAQGRVLIKVPTVKDFFRALCA